jgi:predicted nucleic acid-binding protein
VKGIADTGFLVAFANRRDRHHAWAVRLAAEITAPLLTCEAVLAESAFHLRDTHLVLEMVATGLVTRAFNLAENLDHLAQLAQRYADREPDLADLCLIRMSELHPRHVVVTVDRTDLRIYRRNKRDAIPLACPTER